MKKILLIAMILGLSSPVWAAEPTKSPYVIKKGEIYPRNYLVHLNEQAKEFTRAVTKVKKKPSRVHHVPSGYASKH